MKNVRYKEGFLISAIDFPNNPKFYRILLGKRQIKRYKKRYINFMEKFSKWPLTIREGSACRDFNGKLYFKHAATKTI